MPGGVTIPGGIMPGCTPLGAMPPGPPGPMPQYGTWVPYSGSARLILAIVLLAAAGGLVYAAIRLRRPVRLPRPGSPRRLPPGASSLNV